MPLPTPSKNENDRILWRYRKKSKSLFEKADEEYQASMCEEESSADYKYRNPKTGEVFTYTRRGLYKKDGVILVYKGKV